MNDYNNLIAQFMHTCDYKGKYEAKTVPRKLVFQSNLEKEHNIRQCLKYVNTSDWKHECSFICKKFNLIRWNAFFSPKITQYVHFTEEMNDLVKEWDKQEANYMFYLRLKNIKKQKKPKRYRILQSSNTQKTGQNQQQGTAPTEAQSKKEKME